jgi:hypothetical protein
MSQKKLLAVLNMIWQHFSFEKPQFIELKNDIYTYKKNVLGIW